MDNKPDAPKQGLLKYLVAGLIVALILFSIITLSKKGVDPNLPLSYVWSPETDSDFVKNCYNQYRPQIKDDMAKQEATKSYCRCMLQKVKTKYSEEQITNVRDADIKIWDTECRDINSKK